MSPIQRLRLPRSPLIFAVLSALLAAVAGCRSLPESGVTSFAAATSTLTVTVSAAGNTAVQDVADVHDGSAPSKAIAAALSNELKQQWASRLEVMRALDRYAASLSALVTSGKVGRENAKAFGDAVRGLASAVEVAVPAGPSVTAALALAERAYGEIAEHLAAGRIHRAVESANPAIAALSGLIAEDLLNLRSIAIERRRTAVTQLRAQNDLVPQLNSLREARASAAASALDPNANPAALERLRQLNAAIAALASDPQYVSYTAREAEVERLFRAQSDLLDQAAATVQAWAAAHHDLVVGMRQKRAPSLAQLGRLTNDLYDIYQDYRKARAAGRSAGSEP